MRWPFWLFSLFALASPAAHATVDYQLTRPDIALQVEAQSYSTRVFALLHRLTVREAPDAPPALTARALIENQLVAAHARATLGEAVLLGQDDHVGFPGQVQLDDQYVATLQALFATELAAHARTLPAAGVDRFITQQPRLTSPRLKQLLALQGRQEFGLSPGQQQAAARVPVLAYRFPGAAPARITLADVYSRQNVQGRVMLHDGDVDFLRQQARRQLGQRFIRHWAERHAGLSRAEFAELERAIRERNLRERYLRQIGLLADMHNDNPRLKALAAEVSAAEVQAYYQAHQADFRRIEKARGRHLRLADQASAERVHAELTQGLAFDEAVRRYSAAADRSAPVAGDLGWVLNDNQAKPWLSSLLLMLPVGKPSQPLRTPALPDQGAPAWEIILVDEQVEGIQAPDSEGVRYEAAQVIARRKALEAYQATQRQLVANAVIHCNPAAVGRNVL